MAKDSLIPGERIENAILLIRGHKVLLDSDLADLYGVPTKRLNEQVRRNRARFPGDFMFQLTAKETAALRSQTATASQDEAGMRSQFATASRRNVRYRPFAFTEHGVAMLSSVLNSDQAIEVNIAIMRAFVKLREVLATHKDLAQKLADLEKKLGQHDEKFQIVFEAIRRLMAPPAEADNKRRIGFARDN
jgi:hypothetical protein